MLSSYSADPQLRPTPILHYAIHPPTQPTPSVVFYTLRAIIFATPSALAEPKTETETKTWEQQLLHTCPVLPLYPYALSTFFVLVSVLVSS